MLAMPPFAKGTAGQIAYRLYDRSNFITGQACPVTSQLSGPFSKG